MAENAAQGFHAVKRTCLPRVRILIARGPSSAGLAMSESSKYTNEKNDGNEVLSGRQNENSSWVSRQRTSRPSLIERSYQAHEAAALSQGCVEAMKGPPALSHTSRGLLNAARGLFPHPNRGSPWPAITNAPIPRRCRAKRREQTRLPLATHFRRPHRGPDSKGALPHLHRPLGLSPLGLPPN